MDRLWQGFAARCARYWQDSGISGHRLWPVFSERLDAEFHRLGDLLHGLYGQRPDFAFQFAGLIDEVFAAYCQRPAWLLERDRRLPPESGWFLDCAQIGAVAYVDRFAGNFKALIGRIPYLQELGVTYLHLMPFYLSPEPENDGGYAVSSYRQCSPALGSIEDLDELARAMAEANIILVADFVFNHTSDEHLWASRARAGDPEYQDYYFMFNDPADTHVYQAHLRDIFPELRTGSFTQYPDMGKWVWTSFNSYQWDLNYRNPAVFRAMAVEMIALANRGVAILRLDAVAFIWKEAGTNCENLPQAHSLIQALQCVARLACPSLLFKSEAIVHPDDIVRYIDLRECQLSYNPLLMAELWEAAATKDSSLLAHSLRKRQHLPDGCTWINYVRCHDDIGWTFADEDAGELGIKGGDHRAFLNDFYLGSFPGSFSRGLSFQYNPANGDRRICGTTASLAGLERSMESGSANSLATALRRIQLLYGLAFSVGGIPLLYLGDELGVLNDYSYQQEPAHAADSRWVHRPLWPETLFRQREDSSSPAGQVFAAIKRLAAVRRQVPAFGHTSLAVLDSGHRSVLAFHKQAAGQLVTVLANFAEEAVWLEAERLAALLVGRDGRNLLDDRLVPVADGLCLEPCELLWILAEG